MSSPTWIIDAGHSGIHFSARHMLVSKVRGHFEKYSGKLRIDDADMTRSAAEVVIDAASIETGVQERDAHLRSADFLDVENHPVLRFHSTRVERLDESRYRMLGELTIVGVTREVSIEVEYGGRVLDPWGNERIGFAAKASLDRRDFGLTWNQVLEAGGVVVGDRIEITLDLEAIRTAARAAA